MDTECRARWDRSLDEQEETERQDLENNWDSSKEWTFVLIKDPSNQEPLLMRQLGHAKQRDGQSPSDFHMYLDSLEKHFDRPAEKQRALSFYAKLQVGLQDHINLHSPTLPSNREEMVALATRYWDSIPHSQKL